MAQLRMQTQMPGARFDSRYPVDSDLLKDINQVSKILYNYNDLFSLP